MKQFLLFTLLGLSFVYGVASITVTVRRHFGVPSIHTAALIKEVP
ncbi:hypothetical protein [Bradyrhizobium sp.]|nr:hypothetical protein [Bradyrhizobium sp.]